MTAEMSFEWAMATGTWIAVGILGVRGLGWLFGSAMDWLDGE